MALDIVALDAKEAFWDTFTLWGAVGVFIGVGLETVTQFENFFSRLPVLAQKERRELVAKAGVLILQAALALEVYGGVKTHFASKDTVAALSGELKDALAEADDLAKLTKQLRLSNADLQNELTSLTEHSNQFENAIREQESRDNAALANLQTDEKRLKEARLEIFAAAENSSKASAQISSDVVEAGTLLKHMQLMALPRSIDARRSAAITAAIKGYPGTQYDFAVTREIEPADLLVQIYDALDAADWKFQLWTDGGMPLQVNARPALKQVGDLTDRGVKVSISAPDTDTLGPAAMALTAGLNASDIATEYQRVADKLPDGTVNPQAIKQGVIRITVGSKPQNPSP
jgi:hypothetical protein